MLQSTMTCSIFMTLSAAGARAEIKKRRIGDRRDSMYRIGSRNGRGDIQIGSISVFETLQGPHFILSITRSLLAAPPFPLGWGRGFA